jgi:hypothetical protein
MSERMNENVQAAFLSPDGHIDPTTQARRYNAQLH